MLSPKKEEMNSNETPTKAIAKFATVPHRTPAITRNGAVYFIAQSLYVLIFTLYFI